MSRKVRVWVRGGWSQVLEPSSPSVLRDAWCEDSKEKERVVTCDVSYAATTVELARTCLPCRGRVLRYPAGVVVVMLSSTASVLWLYHEAGPL